MPTTPYLAKAILKIDGKSASDALMEDILQIVVEESLHLPTMFTIVVNQSRFSGRSKDQLWEHQNLFVMGKSIKIGFVSSTTASDEFDTANEGMLIEGEITAIETHFTSNSQAPLVIRGYDVSHRLHRGRYNRSFQQEKDSDIVKKIAGEVGINVDTIEDSGIIHDYVFQENQTNMEFLRERAARNGFELFVQDGKLNFRKPTTNESLQLEWLTDLHSFRVRMTSAEQVSSIEVRGWDYEQKKPILGTAKTEQVLTETDNGKGSKVSTTFRVTPKLILVDQPVFKAEEATKMAQALCNEMSGEFIYADAQAEGNPKIRPGKIVTLKEMGNYSGKYYITETRHLLQERVYITEFSVRGLRGGDLLSILSPPAQVQPGQTLLVGIVTNNKDPKGWGRVKVKFPTLTEEHESNWARVVATGAGANRGFDCLPEVNDEVLVAFEHGDIHRPYVLGGVWNGTDATPAKVEDSSVDGKIRLRTFKTRTGHTLQFVEEDKDSSKKGVYVDTVYGHQLHLNDSEEFIEVKTKSGHFVRLDDQNKKVEIKTTGGHQVLMDDSGKNVNFVSTGDVSMKAGTSGTSNKINLNAGEITLTATTKVTIKVGANTIEVSQAGIKIEGTMASMKGSASTKVEGALVNVEATGMATVKGAMVKIN